MSVLLRKGSRGAQVTVLQELLVQNGFPVGEIDGVFGNGVQQALINYQRAHGLVPDGVAGNITMTMLKSNGAVSGNYVDQLSVIDAELVAAMMPFTSTRNIRMNLDGVLQGLRKFNLVTPNMGLMAIATIRAEVESFEPLAEGRSKYNTSPNSTVAFDLYDNRKDLGNRGNPDGFNYRGRGYIQLTGLYNYIKYGKLIGIDLAANPTLACDKNYAGDILAAYLSENSVKIKTALAENDLRYARRLVNGGSHGLDRFSDAYTRGAKILKQRGVM